MPITTMLLDFLMNLLRNPAAADEFRADPQGALDDAGLGSVCSDDVDAVMPVVLDLAPVIGDREYNTGGNSAVGGDAHVAPTTPAAPSTGTAPGSATGGEDDHAHAVQQLTHVVNNYSYTEVDDRDTITDQSVNQNIWADGDVSQLFDQDAIIASGDDAIAAGGDVDVDKSTSYKAGEDINIGNTDNSDRSNHSVNVSDVLNGSLNDNSDNSADGSDNSDHSADGSDNSDHSVNGSYNDNSDHSADGSDNSTDNSDNSDHSADGSDNSVNTDNSDNSDHSADESDNSVNTDN